MLSLPINDLRAANEGAVFMLFIWEELFAQVTPDSYQPKLLHIPALVDELGMISGRANRSTKWEKHVEKIQEELKSACNRQATIALRSGRTADDFIHLYSKDNFRRRQEEVLDLILVACIPTLREYRCIAAVTGKIGDLQVIGRKAGFDVIGDRPLPGGANAERFREQTNGKIWLFRKVEAVKPLEAAHAVIRQLRPAIDIFNFYSHESMSFHEAVLVVETDQKSEIVQPQQRWYWQLRERRNAKDLTKTFLRVGGKKGFDRKVLNALEHYSLAQTSGASRVRLINLWSALECLTTGDDAGASIIGSVCAAVVPMVVWRRTAKILSYTAKTLLDFKESSQGSLGPGFPVDEGLSTTRLMLALSKSSDHPDHKGLEAFIAQHPALRFRLGCLCELFGQPQNLAKELKLSAKRVEWHLYRIYRARNLIVHEGEEVPHIPRLLENLHYYFCVTLSRILHGMQLNPTWELFDCIVYWKTRYDYIINSLERGRGHKG